MFTGQECAELCIQKVAMEVAIGASISGVRAMASMKMVGVNVASDPLYTVSYIGANGGLGHERGVLWHWLAS